MNVAYRHQSRFTRSRDDALLRALSLRVDSRFTAKQAAEATGLPRNTVLRAHWEILHADMKESGENRADVLAHYWDGAALKS